MLSPLDAATSAYGSDRAGLLWGYLFTPGAAGHAISSAAAVEWLRRTPDQQGDDFVWLHFDLVNAATEQWIQQNLDLSEAFFEMLHEGSHSTRVEYADGTLISVVNDVLFDFSFDASQISTIWLSVDRHMLVSARKKPLRSIDRLRAAVKNGELFGSSVELLVHLLHAQADVLAQIARDSIAKVDEIEDQMLRGRPEQNRTHLGHLRSVMVRLKRLLAPEPAALFRLLNRPPDWMSEADAQELRQSTEEFSVSLNDVATLEERIKLLQEEIAAQVQEQNNRSLFVLTIFTVLALPVNIVAGLFGMNVGGVPFTHQPYGFWIIIAFIITFSLVAGHWLFRRL